MVYHPFRNPGLKLLAVGLATVLWLTVLGEREVERGLRVPLEFRNLPHALEIVGDLPSAVDVRVRGASGLLSRLETGEVVAVLDMANARPGSRLFPLRADAVHVPFGVEVAHVSPGTVALVIERSGESEVPVVPAIEGAPAPGFVVSRVDVSPATVTVRGPVSRLRELRQATTEPVSIDDTRGPVTDVVTIGVIDPALRLSEALSATVVVEVIPSPAGRALSGVPVQVRDLGEGLRAELMPTVVTVGIRGESATLDGFDADSVTVFVDLAGLGPGQYNLPVRLEPFPDLGISGTDPSTIVVRVR